LLLDVCPRCGLHSIGNDGCCTVCGTAKRSPDQGANGCSTRCMASDVAHLHGFVAEPIGSHSGRAWSLGRRTASAVEATWSALHLPARRPTGVFFIPLPSVLAFSLRARATFAPHALSSSTVTIGPCGASTRQRANRTSRRGNHAPPRGPGFLWRFPRGLLSPIRSSGTARRGDRAPLFRREVSRAFRNPDLRTP
jgi:hypothetical protein